jgi:hypothetical protein
VLPIAEALEVAVHFVESGGMGEPSSWFEL